MLDHEILRKFWTKCPKLNEKKRGGGGGGGGGGGRERERENNFIRFYSL